MHKVFIRLAITCFCFFFSLKVGADVISGLFRGNTNIAETADYFVGNAIVSALQFIPVTGMILAIDHYLSKVTQRSLLISSALTFLSMPLLYFYIATAPMKSPINFNYRGCEMRILGELTECGWKSAFADLAAGSALAIAFALIAYFSTKGLSNVDF